MSSFFAGPDTGWEVTPATPERVLGGYESTCSNCGRAWNMIRGQCVCGSTELTTRYHEPKLLERIGTTIKAVVVPAKRKPPRPNAAQVDALRALQSSVTDLLDALASVDGQLRSAVRADCEALQPAQALVNTALSIDGDRSIQRVPGMSLALASFGAGLDAILKDLDEDSK